MVAQIKEQVKKEHKSLWEALAYFIANGIAPTDDDVPEEWKKANGK